MGQFCFGGEMGSSGHSTGGPAATPNSQAISAFCHLRHSASSFLSPPPPTHPTHLTLAAALSSPCRNSGLVCITSQLLILSLLAATLAHPRRPAHLLGTPEVPSHLIALSSSSKPCDTPSHPRRCFLDNLMFQRTTKDTSNLSVLIISART
jgi:hypothetical protein